MKITKVVGIDIGNYRIKISYIVKGELKDVFVETLPDNIVKDGMIQYWDAMADFLNIASAGLRLYLPISRLCPA